MAKVGPGGMIPYGAPIDAHDIERRSGSDPAAWLTKLTRALIQAAITADGIAYLVPHVTDRITTPDGGVDASLTVEVELAPPRTLGLVNPGRTIYQIKWRSKPETIIRAAHNELRKLKENGNLPDCYVFVTNVGLVEQDRRRIVAELRKGCEEFPEEKIVVLGASELTDRVNNDPRVRLAYFDVGVGLCSLEAAQEMAERRYGNIDAVPPLYDRSDEIESIQRFLHEPTTRALVVHGPQGSGKTRVVIEGLSEVRDRVVWASDVPAQAPGLVRMLDDSPYQAILVVDDAESDVESLLRSALGAKRVKTIVVSPWPSLAPGAGNLPIAAFRASGAHEFLGRVYAGMPVASKGWLYEQFGGLPGLLLYGAEALKAGIEPDPLREPSYEAVLEAYENRMTRGLDQASAALSVLAVFPRFLEGSKGEADIRVLCNAVGVSYADVAKSVEVLKKRNLIGMAGFREDGVYQVTPPLFGRRLARRILQGIAGNLRAIYQQLSDGGKVELVRRVAELNTDPAFSPFLRWLLLEPGVFVSLDTCAANAAAVVALADALPSPTARELGRLLAETDIERLRTELKEDARRQIVHALERLVYREATFDEGAKGLLRLAAAENEKYGNNAAGVFSALFNWKHPDIPKDARLRARLLSQLAGKESPLERKVVARAAGHSLKTNLVVTSWQGEGVAPPERGWRAVLWRDVHDAVRPVADVLKRLAVDQEEVVREEAIAGLTQGVGGLIEVGLVEEAVGALEFLATLPLNGAQRARLVEGVAFVIADVKRMLEAAEGDEYRASLSGGLRRGLALFGQLTSESFRSRFFHWLGPAPLRAKLRMGEPADPEEVASEGVKLAEEVVKDPTLFDATLLDWVSREDAQNAGYFLYAVGKADRARQWLGELESRLGERNGVSVLATYVAGWFEGTPEEARAYLTAISGKDRLSSEAVVDAVWRIGGAAGAVELICRCVLEGQVDRKRVAWRLGWGRLGDVLSLNEYLTVVGCLRDGSLDVEWALLEALDRRWRNKVSERGELAPLARDLLVKTSGAAGRGHEPFHWDGMAAELAKWDAEVGFELLFAHLAHDSGSGVFIAHHRSQLIEVLSARDRGRVVRTLLDAALGAEGWRVGMELPHLIKAETDTAVLLEYTAAHGVDAARLVAENLDASQAEFWELLPALIVRWGDDQEVREGIIRSITWIRDTYSSKEAVLRPRAEFLDRMIVHEDPLVREIARQARSQLAQELREGDA